LQWIIKANKDPLLSNDDVSASARRTSPIKASHDDVLKGSLKSKSLFSLARKSQAGIFFLKLI
jgi:hypothetical protein